ncbi:carboxyl transferase domain-containing protein [Arenicella xantha]|uniref:Acetyl-CoA carboxylase carboxyltransferase component n=1 Tax=Arenicella xantha TaxID=644221 RepID=A0A395JKD6_9GAMM|nr:carboxyl transferase domain-containing protein [Arenicella xantha]RBP49671.1 acetyl-CoA carboxylase carboxyltransferase component [Arenicella xantha]
MSNVTEVPAPLTGTVLEVHIGVGQTVKAGELLVLLESMKVHVRIEAEHSGQVQWVFVANGQNVQRGASLLSIMADQSTTHKADIKQSDKTPHPSIAALAARQALSLDDARADATTKRHAKGYRTARENLSALCDDLDNFQEYGQLAVAAQRNRTDYETLKTSTAADGIITGVAQVNGHSTALIINDYSVLAGTQGFFHHQKLDRMLHVASKQNLPIIMFTEGGGGRPGDTDITTVNSGLHCTSFGTWAGLSGQVPRIAVANGYNFAGNAALFGAADITIATEQSWIGMAGPAMIEGGGLGSFAPKDIGPISIQQTNGVVDIVARDEAHAAELATQVLSYFQAERLDWQAPEQTPLASIMPINRRQTYEVRNIINTLSDTNSWCELKRGYGSGIITGFARIEGQSIGIMANDCTVLGGAIDVAAGEKAAGFMQLCDQFSIPVLTLCDTPGFMVGPDHEGLGAVRRLAELFRVGAQLTVPLWAVVLRKCYGLGAQAMLGGSTHRPNYTLAWPTGEFGPMGLEGAVKLGFSKQLAAEPDTAKREALYQSLLDEQYQRGQAIEVASVLEIDAVIDPTETRQHLASQLANRSL